MRVLPRVQRDREQRAGREGATPDDIQSMSVHNRTLGLQMTELNAERHEVKPPDTARAAKPCS